LGFYHLCPYKIEKNDFGVLPYRPYGPFLGGPQKHFPTISEKDTIKNTSGFNETFKYITTKFEFIYNNI
jgi:hypothetical protein